MPRMSASGGGLMNVLAILPALPAADPPKAGTGQLLLAALVGIAVVVVLITVLKVHPFISLILGSAVLGLTAALGADATIKSFSKGVGDTVSAVGLLIALGAMIGALLADSGGGDRIVDTIVQRVSGPALGHGRGGGADRPAAVLRDRGRAARPGRAAGGDPGRRPADEGRHPGPR